MSLTPPLLYDQVNCLHLPLPEIHQGLDPSELRGHLDSNASMCLVISNTCSFSHLSCPAPHFLSISWSFDYSPFSVLQTPSVLPAPDCLLGLKPSHVALPTRTCIFLVPGGSSTPTSTAYRQGNVSTLPLMPHKLPPLLSSLLPHLLI